MEKTLRVLGGGEDAHGHSHSHSNGDIKADGHSTSVSTYTNGHADGLKARKSEKAEVQSGHVNGDAEVSSSASGPSKLSAYLNLFGDFVHNMYVNVTFMENCFEPHN